MERITTPFGFHSTAGDVIAGVDLRTKRAIVTGAASGIGVETASALARAGADVTLAVRSREAGEEIAATIRRDTGSDSVGVRELDLSERESIARFVAAWSGPLHILVNNAGIMALPELTKTTDGWEMQFATNFLGHFALTIGLHHALVAAHGARVVSLSSSGNMLAPVLFDDLHFDFVRYDPLIAYGQSKSACALFAVEAFRRWENDQIFVNTLHPGAIATNLQKHTGGVKTPPEMRKSREQGAATSVLLAASPFVAGVGGRYFEDCNEAAMVSRRPTDFSGGYAPYAMDPENARRLWIAAERLLQE